MNHTHCCYCRRRFTDENPKTNDHFIPVSRGGKESGSNKLQCCYECNQWKADKLPEYWLGRVEYCEKRKMKINGYSINDYRQIIGSLRHFIKKMSGELISDYKYKG
jgi:hypothetical protein